MHGYSTLDSDKPGDPAKLIDSVIPVGEAWLRGMDRGLADPNPHDGIAAGQIDLWGRDHYHASTEGYYLEALMVFGAVTGRDPRSLGQAECSAFELGVPPATAKALQQVAFDQLSATRTLALALPATATPTRCAP